MLKFNHKLLYAEETLAAIKKALRTTPLWTALKVKHSEDYNPSTMLARVGLNIEGFPGFNNFLKKFWAKTRGFKGTSAFVSIEDAPSYFMFQTDNRRAFYENIPKLARALHTRKVSLRALEVNWRSDLTRLRSNGIPRHFQSYELIVDLNSATPFDAEAWLVDALLEVCPSKDARADDYPFDAIERKLGFNKCRGMEKTASGLVLRFDNMAAAQLTVNAVYGDCDPVYRIEKKTGHVFVTLTYPDMQEALEMA